MKRDIRISAPSTSRLAASGNASNSSMMCLPCDVTSLFYRGHADPRAAVTRGRALAAVICARQTWGPSTPSSPTMRSTQRPSTGISPSNSRPTPTWSIRRIVMSPGIGHRKLWTTQFDLAFILWPDATSVESALSLASRYKTIKH